MPKREDETLRRSADESDWNSHIHEVRHDLRIVDLGILGIVTPSLNRYGPGGLNQPAGKRPLAELGSFRSETKEAAFLRRRSR